MSVRSHARVHKLLFLTALLAVSSTLLVVAAAGDVDQTFGTLGQVKTHFYAGFDAAGAVAVQNDGKIVAAGFADDASFIPVLAVARYDADGNLDAAFGSGGKVTIDLGIVSSVRVDLAIDAAGRIVVVGTVTRDPSLPSDVGVARLTPGGALDATFGVGGTVTTDVADFADEANSVAIQSDGKIVVAGTARSNASLGAADFAVIRYKPDGSLDASFDGDGKVTTDFFGFDDQGNGVAIQTDGRIVVAGTAKPANDTSDFAVVRYDANGTLDSTFDGDGRTLTDIAGNWDDGNAVAIQPGDEGIVVVGGAGGKVVTDFSNGDDMGSDVVIAGDGRIVAAGWVADPADVELLIATSQLGRAMQHLVPAERSSPISAPSTTGRVSRYRATARSSSRAGRGRSTPGIPRLAWFATTAAAASSRRRRVREHRATGGRIRRRGRSAR